MSICVYISTQLYIYISIYLYIYIVKLKFAKANFRFFIRTKVGLQNSYSKNLIKKKQ